MISEYGYDAVDEIAHEYLGIAVDYDRVVLRAEIVVEFVKRIYNSLPFFSKWINEKLINRLLRKKENKRAKLQQKQKKKQTTSTVSDFF